MQKAKAKVKLLQQDVHYMAWFYWSTVGEHWIIISARSSKETVFLEAVLDPNAREIKNKILSQTLLSLYM